MANHFSIVSASLSELRNNIFTENVETDYNMIDWVIINTSHIVSPLIKSLLLRSLYWNVDISDIGCKKLFFFLECFYHLKTVKTLIKLGVSQTSIDDILCNVKHYEDYLARSKLFKECDQESAYFNLINKLSRSDVDFDQLLDDLQLFHLRLYKKYLQYLSET